MTSGMVLAVLVPALLCSAVAAGFLGMAIRRRRKDAGKEASHKEDAASSLEECPQSKLAVGPTLLGSANLQVVLASAASGKTSQDKVLAVVQKGCLFQGKACCSEAAIVGVETNGLTMNAHPLSQHSGPKWEHQASSPVSERSVSPRVCADPPAFEMPPSSSPHLLGVQPQQQRSFQEPCTPACARDVIRIALEGVCSDSQLQGDQASWQLGPDLPPRYSSKGSPRIGVSSMSPRTAGNTPRTARSSVGSVASEWWSSRFLEA